jgi:hypothetical protein
MRSSKRTAGEPVDKLMRVRGTMSLVDKRFVLKPRRPISVIAIAMK